jgi:Predicted Zn-dependent hydrolases of the beta-lactamase fold
MSHSPDVVVELANEINEPVGVPMVDAGSLFRKKRFHNHQTPQPMTLLGLCRLFGRYLFARPAVPAPIKPLRVQKLTASQLLASSEDTLYRLGHSTLLLRLDGEFWLTDPVFAKRASPLQWIGPKRFHEPPLMPEQLPALKGVLISHNHYDHLDEMSIKALALRCEHFYVPLGVGRQLQQWGIAADAITELDWWQSVQVGKTQLVATPARHFSGRGLLDTDRTLWCSWVIRSPQFSLFFSGDTGYFDGFKQIGTAYGPFDITCIETGAYDPSWPDVHMLPEHSLQAHLDLQGRYMLPIHNGTFDLALHDWFEPFERIMTLALAQQVSLLMPQMGEPVQLRTPPGWYPWWRQPETELLRMITAMGAE